MQVLQMGITTILNDFASLLPFIESVCLFLFVVLLFVFVVFLGGVGLML